MSSTVDPTVKLMALNFRPERSVSWQAGLQRAFGTLLFVAIVALWFAPGADMSSELFGTKMLFSIVSGFMAIALWQASFNRARVSYEIDTIRRQVRLMKSTRQGPTVLRSCRFDDLARVEREGHSVRLWDADGSFLADVSLRDASMRTSLLRALTDAGKL